MCTDDRFEMDVLLSITNIVLSVCMSLVTKALHRYLNENQQSSEMYMTAQRTVKMGLTASAIVSAWTWVCIAEILFLWHAKHLMPMRQ